MNHHPRVLAVRLKPGQDLKEALETWIREENLQAAYIGTLVGSLTRLCLRLAMAEEVAEWEGPFEIVSAVGTLCPDGIHVHLSASDRFGTTLGGHLMPGCRIHTTVELVVVQCPDLVFSRRPDPNTGYDELVVESAPPSER